jgi:hypothetical protein
LFSSDNAIPLIILSLRLVQIIQFLKEEKEALYLMSQEERVLFEKFTSLNPKLNSI